MIKVGIIGCGYWGPNHIRIFSQLANSQAVMCADLDENRLANVKDLYPNLQTTTNYKDILTNDEIRAVCIASPTNTHFNLTKEALEHGKHVLVEKPLALHTKECQELKELAEKKKLVLMVGHVFLFNSSIQWLKDYIKAGEMGQIYYAYCTRTNLGPFRYDVNALWDLAPHDISILNYLFEGSPINVSGRGQKSLGSSLEDLSFATMEYEQGIIANVHVSWLDPKKVRQMTIVGEKKMVTWDDLDGLGPIKLYDKHVEKTSTYYATYGEFQLLSKEGSITLPNISASEPLKAQGQYFMECVEKVKNPDLADAQKGLEVVKTLCGIQESMDLKGTCVAII